MGVRCSSIVPHRAAFTETDLQDQTGKLFIVTGGTGGLGKELIQILYRRNAKIYIAARSESKSKDLITALQQKYPDSRGDLIPSNCNSTTWALLKPPLRSSSHKKIVLTSSGTTPA